MANKSKYLIFLFLSSSFCFFDAQARDRDGGIGGLFNTESPEVSMLRANLKLQASLSTHLENSIKKLGRYKAYLADKEGFLKAQARLSKEEREPIDGLTDEYIQHQIESLEGIGTTPGKLALIQEQIDALLLTSKSKWGENIARAMSGDRGWHGKVDNIGDGFMQGLAYRIATDFSKSLSTRISGALDKIFGLAFTFAVDSGLSAWSRLCDDIFHDGYAGFTEDSLDAWAHLINDTFKDMSKIIKEGLKDSLRGRDMALRPFDESKKDFDGDDDVVVPELTPEQAAELAKQEAELAALDPWRILVAFYSGIFERLIEEFNERIKHYAPKSIEVFYAQKIVSLLTQFKAIIEKTKTINELDARFKSNKAFINAFQDGLGNIFKYLIEKVKSTGSTLDVSGRNRSRSKKKSSFLSDDDDDDDSYNKFSDI
ncbi:MAG: hypothetical protein ABH827_01980 [bacterium]